MSDLRDAGRFELGQQLLNVLREHTGVHIVDRVEHVADPQVAGCYAVRLTWPHDEPAVFLVYLAPHPLAGSAEECDSTTWPPRR